MVHWTHQSRYPKQHLSQFSRFWVTPFVKRFTLRYWTVVLSSLSVPLVYCGQTDQDETWHTLCYMGTQLSPHKGAQQPPVSKFTGAGFACVCIVRGPCLLWPNGWMDQDASWYRGGPWLRPHCVRWGCSSPSPNGYSPPVFSPCLLWPNGIMDQDATW